MVSLVRIIPALTLSRFGWDEGLAYYKKSWLSPGGRNPTLAWPVTDILNNSGKLYTAGHETKNI